MGESSGELSPQSESKQGALARLFSSIKFLVEPDLPVEERRVGGRLECSLATSFVTELGESQECTVVDVSRRGLRIRTARAVSKGITLALKPPAEMGEKYALLMARVMWTRKDDEGRNTAGLLLPPGTEHEESWLDAYLLSRGYTVGGPQRRKYLRADSELPGRLVLKDNTAIEVVLLNLSLGGALIRCQPAIENMSPFRLQIGPMGKLAELEISGTILRQTPNNGEPFHFHSSRFMPLEEKRHAQLKKYIVTLLRQARTEARAKKKA